MSHGGPWPPEITYGNNNIIFAERKSPKSHQRLGHFSIKIAANKCTFWPNNGPAKGTSRINILKCFSINSAIPKVRGAQNERNFAIWPSAGSHKNFDYIAHGTPWPVLLAALLM